MMEKPYPQLGETVAEARLSNGLLARVVRKPGFAKAYAFMAVNYGSMDSRFRLGGKLYDAPMGVAHYLEHKLFESEEGDAFERFAATGANANAYTSFGA